jgi:hypothetical protein
VLCSSSPAGPIVRDDFIARIAVTPSFRRCFVLSKGAGAFRRHNIQRYSDNKGTHTHVARDGVGQPRT